VDRRDLRGGLCVHPVHARRDLAVGRGHPGPLLAPLLVLRWFDLSRGVRDLPTSSKALRAVGILFGLPQALFGLVSIAIGAGLTAWVVYNSFVERLPEYTGGFLTLGIGPALVAFGTVWVRSAFDRSDPRGRGGA